MVELVKGDDNVNYGAEEKPEQDVAIVSHSLWSKHFWKAVAERGLKTFAQALAGLITADAIGILEVAWIPVLSVAGMQFVYSVLTSIGSGIATHNGPSLVDSEVIIARRGIGFKDEQEGV